MKKRTIITKILALSLFVQPNIFAMKDLDKMNYEGDIGQINLRMSVNHGQTEIRIGKIGRELVALKRELSRKVPGWEELKQKLKAARTEAAKEAKALKEIIRRNEKASVKDGSK